MSISIKEVEHIAKLARLGLSETEKKKYSKELSGILDYIGKLNEADTPKESAKADSTEQAKNVEPVTQAAGLFNVFRKDENAHEINVERVKKIIGQFPDRENNFVKTKTILEK